MALTRIHELHERRWGRNLGVGLLLAFFVAIVFGLTLVKAKRGEPMQAFDHVARPELEMAPARGGAPAPVDQSGGAGQ